MSDHAETLDLPLPLCVLDCDGGMYSPQFCAENMLKDDTSVYSTAPSRREDVNLVLCAKTGRQAATAALPPPAFTLTAITAAAPSHGFTSPLAHAVVFASWERPDPGSVSAWRGVRSQADFCSLASSQASPFSPAHSPLSSSPASLPASSPSPSSFSPASASPPSFPSSLSSPHPEPSTSYTTRTEQPLTPPQHTPFPGAGLPINTQAMAAVAAALLECGLEPGCGLPGMQAECTECLVAGPEAGPAPAAPAAVPEEAVAGGLASLRLQLPASSAATSSTMNNSHHQSSNSSGGSAGSVYHGMGQVSEPVTRQQQQQAITHVPAAPAPSTPPAAATAQGSRSNHLFSTISGSRGVATTSTTTTPSLSHSPSQGSLDVSLPPARITPVAFIDLEHRASPCTVSLPVPVCGRYLLVKLLRPRCRYGEGLDVERLVLRGHTGPPAFASGALV